MLYDSLTFHRRLDALLEEVILAEHAIAHLARIVARRRGGADDADLLHQQAMRLRARRIDLEDIRRPPQA